MVLYPKFNGVYSEYCKAKTTTAIGSCTCVGLKELNIKPCEFMKSYKEENTYQLFISKEIIKIISEVECNSENSPGFQLSLF